MLECGAAGARLLRAAAGGTVRARIGLVCVHNTIAIRKTLRPAIVPKRDGLRARDALYLYCVPLAAVVMAAVEEHGIVGSLEKLAELLTHVIAAGIDLFVDACAHARTWWAREV